MKNDKMRRKLINCAIELLMVFLAFLCLIPIIFVILTAFKTDAEVSLASFKWLPSSFYLGNFVHAFENGDWPRYFFNSLFVTAVVVGGSLIFNSLAGFAFARFDFKGRNPLFFFLLIGMMIPPQSIIIPQFIIMRSIPLAGGNNWLGQGGIGWLDSLSALIFPFLAGSFGVFLCRQFYIQFPKSLDEAARIDGCGDLRLYVSIYLPLSKQILATLCILKSVSTWNDFFFPLVMTSGDDARTIQLALQMMKGSMSTHWNWIMAGALVTMLPMMIVFLLAQKHFVQGIVSTGLKN